MAVIGQDPLWELEKITKVFPGVIALAEVSLKIYKGEIHSLVGENGSGKSTLVKCLSGVHMPSSGRLLYKGKETQVTDPHKAQTFGVGTIFQELSLIPALSVAENIFLGEMPKKHRIVDWSGMHKKAENLLSELDIHIETDTPVSELSIGEKQMLEIAKALSKESELLIMDEPTAALDMKEIRVLHRLIKNLASRQCAILYISHRMDEIEAISDIITILKDGKLVHQSDSKSIAIDDVVRIMIGSDIKDHFPKKDNRKKQVLLKVENLKAEEKVKNVSFNIHQGEVFGLAGVAGSGRTELANALFGLNKILSGKISLYSDSDGKRNPPPKCCSSPQKAIKYGVAMITENRKENGLFFNFNGIKNITVANLKKIKKLRLLNLKKELRSASEYIKKLNIPKTAKIHSVDYLSGGNQQKVVFSRWIFSEADLFIMDEPTQGIDVGAKVEVYNLLNDLTSNKKAILLISSDFEELQNMSDRIGIIHDGELTEVIDARDINRQKLTQMVVSRRRYSD